MNDMLATLKSRFEPKEASATRVDRQLNAVRFSACGRYLLAAGFDGTVRRFDATGEGLVERAPLTGHQGWVQRLALPAARDEQPPEPVVYSADSWGQLRCATIDDPSAVRWSVADAHNGWIVDLGLSPTGAFLATCGIDRHVRVWSTAEGQRLLEFANPEAEVLSVAMTPDEAHVVSGDLLGTVRQWDRATGALVREFKLPNFHKSDRLQEVGGIRRMMFTPDGQHLLCAGTRPKGGGNVQGIPAIAMVEWSTGQVQKTLELGKEGDVYVTDLAFHPEGFLMITVSGNPGVGKLIFRRLEDDAAFFETTKMPNCHSVALHPDRIRLAIVATNAGSNGNGRRLDKDGHYPGNHSPIHLWRLPTGS